MSCPRRHRRRRGGSRERAASPGPPTWLGASRGTTADSAHGAVEARLLHRVELLVPLPAIAPNSVVRGVRVRVRPAVPPSLSPDRVFSPFAQDPALQSAAARRRPPWPCARSGFRGRDCARRVAHRIRYSILLMSLRDTLRLPRNCASMNARSSGLRSGTAHRRAAQQRPRAPGSAQAAARRRPRVDRRGSLAFCSRP